MAPLTDEVQDTKYRLAVVLEDGEDDEYCGSAGPAIKLRSGSTNSRASMTQHRTL